MFYESIVYTYLAERFLQALAFLRITTIIIVLKHTTAKVKIEIEDKTMFSTILKTLLLR